MTALRFRLNRLESYVLTRTLTSVGVALLIIAGIILLVDFVTISKDVGGRAKDISTGTILGLTALQSPSVILLLLPFAFLFGVLAAFVGLNRRSELIAMRAAGVSAWRFILPATVAAAVIGVANVLVLNPLASQMNAQYEEQKAALMNGYLGEAGNKAIWMRQGDGKGQVIIHALSRDKGPGVVLRSVSFFAYTLDKEGGLKFSRRVDADEARLEPKQWKLIGVREGAPGGATITSPSLAVPSTLNTRTAVAKFASAQSVPFWGLPEVISRTERAGFSATAYRLQMQVLLATPVLYAAMSILAAAFSLRLFRSGGLSGLVASAVGLGFVFFFLNQLCGALGRAEIIPPILAAWTPPLLTLLSGVTLLAYTEDG